MNKGRPEDEVKKEFEGLKERAKLFQNQINSILGIKTIPSAATGAAQNVNWKVKKQ